MTKGQAREWVHNKLIIVEMGYDELVAAFTVLVERPPGRADRLNGLFRRCCEIVSASATPWNPAEGNLPEGAVSPPRTAGEGSDTGERPRQRRSLRPGWRQC